MEITPELALKAYAAGIFPMADAQDAEEVFWVDPKQRGILPLNEFHLPRRLKRTLRRQPFVVTVDKAFAQVISACAEPQHQRENTWINHQIETLFIRLHTLGFAHSIECWRSEQLVGGLYGLSLGSAFFGESMFTRETDASKIALVHLVARLKAGGYSLLDTQFVTEHLKHFGACEISRDAYQRLLAAALAQSADFYSLDAGAGAGAPEAIAQLVSHTS